MVVPAYNEEEMIPFVLDEVMALSEQLDLQVLVVDDGSADGTGIVAKEKGARVLRTERNLGYGEAMKLGLRCAAESSADIVVTIDADGSYRPSDIPRLIRPISEDKADVVIGSRFMAGMRGGAARIPLGRRITSSMISLLARILLGARLTDMESGFRAYRKTVVPSLLDLKATRLDFPTKSVLRLDKARFAEIPVNMRPRNMRIQSYLGIAQAWSIVGEATRVWLLSTCFR